MMFRGRGTGREGSGKNGVALTLMPHLVETFKFPAMGTQDVPESTASEDACSEMG